MKRCACCKLFYFLGRERGREREREIERERERERERENELKPVKYLSNKLATMPTM